MIASVALAAAPPPAAVSHAAREVCSAQTSPGESASGEPVAPLASSCRLGPCARLAGARWRCALVEIPDGSVTGSCSPMSEILSGAVPGSWCEPGVLRVGVLFVRAHGWWEAHSVFVDGRSDR